jgi:hypothetical protein
VNQRVSFFEFLFNQEKKMRCILLLQLLFLSVQSTDINHAMAIPSQVSTTDSNPGSSTTDALDDPASICQHLNGNRDNDNLPYWERVAECLPCTSLPNCGFCLSSLQCLHGDIIGPLGTAVCSGSTSSDGSSESTWIFTHQGAAAASTAHSSGGGCPTAPPCTQESTCLECVHQDECVWCANSTDGGGNCMDVSNIFSNSDVCRAAVFDEPCPASFVSESTVVGNVIVSPDAVFGGGHLDVNQGIVQANDKHLVFSSSAATTISGGHTYDPHSRGGDVYMTAGDGISENRGDGGPIMFVAGNGDVISGANAGDIIFQSGAGESTHNEDASEWGGIISIRGGIAADSTGGRIMLQTMKEEAERRRTAPITITVHMGNTTGGRLIVKTGTSTANKSFTGDIFLRTGDGLESPDFTYNETVAGAGNIVLEAGSSGEATGGEIQIFGGKALQLPPFDEHGNVMEHGSGGDVMLWSGSSRGHNGASGTISIESAHNKAGASTGAIEIATGSTVSNSSSEKPGTINIQTGPAYGGMHASAGQVHVVAGDSTNSVDENSASGSIQLKAGNAKTKGGGINIVAGSGTGAGGLIKISGGRLLEPPGGADFVPLESSGSGRTSIQGGRAMNSAGGALAVSSGGNAAGTSGNLGVATADSSNGISGGAAMGSGRSTQGHSGGIAMDTGSGQNGKGGAIMMSGSSGNRGGGVLAVAGETTSSGAAGSGRRLSSSSAPLGGSVSLLTGASTFGDSGAATLRTASGGVGSGSTTLTSGTASSGSTGTIALTTGSSTPGSLSKAGNIQVQVGTTTGASAGGGAANGGSISIEGGITSSTNSSGGSVTFQASSSPNSGSGITLKSGYGHGSPLVASNGGGGGSMLLKGGTAESTSAGGSVQVTAGGSKSVSGGGITLRSGKSESSSSGGLVLQTANAGIGGASGAIRIATGSSDTGSSPRRDGTSGSITLATPNTRMGSTGAINMKVGMTATDPPSGLAPKGGAITMKSGDSSARLGATGGQIVVKGGEGRNSSPVDGGDGGTVSLKGGAGSGYASGDAGGGITLNAGATDGNGFGGTVALVSGPRYDCGCCW